MPLMSSGWGCRPPLIFFIKWVLLWHAFPTSVRSPLSVLLTVRPKSLADRSPTPTCCANHGFGNWWGGKVRARSLYLSDQVRQSPNAAPSGMRGCRGRCRSRLPRMRRLFSRTTVTAILVRRDPKILRRVSRILNKEGLHFANLFYIFE